jgi:NAD(P)-dependent dehydrogenase (short-subunit alcohol dehydrogenase family)
MNTLFSLEQKTVLITGASSGLGQHFARVLSQAGATVILAARRIDKLQEIVHELDQLGKKAFAVEMDVTNQKSVKNCFDAIQSIANIDVLINNAGVSVTKPLLDQTEEDFDFVMDTNLKGMWLVATEAARRMRENKISGSIVNIASILGERVAGGVAPYAISKAGVIQATKVMALELARYGIRINAILPGYIVTDLNREFLSSELGDKLRSRIPTRRFGELDDLNGPLLLLASDAGKAMSGSCLVVDSGHLVSSL